MRQRSSRRRVPSPVCIHKEKGDCRLRENTQALLWDKDSSDPACAAALAEPEPPCAAADVSKEFIKVTRLQKPCFTAPPFPCHSPENKAPAELHMIRFNYFLIFNVLVKL